MRSRGSLALAAVPVAPWSALGALLHGVVLTLVVAPVLAIVLRPGPAGVLALFGGSLIAITATLYRLLAPGGLEPARVKFMTVVTVFGTFVAVFCAGLSWYRIAYVRDAGGVGLGAGVLALLGLVAFLVAVGASLDAVAAGFEPE